MVLALVQIDDRDTSRYLTPHSPSIEVRHRLIRDQRRPDDRHHAADEAVPDLSLTARRRRFC
jgi:hypothetical protein